MGMGVFGVVYFWCGVCVCVEFGGCVVVVLLCVVFYCSGYCGVWFVDCWCSVGFWNVRWCFCYGGLVVVGCGVYGRSC